MPCIAIFLPKGQITQTKGSKSTLALELGEEKRVRARLRETSANVLTSERTAHHERENIGTQSKGRSRRGSLRINWSYVRKHIV